MRGFSCAAPCRLILPRLAAKAFARVWRRKAFLSGSAKKFRERGVFRRICTYCGHEMDDDYLLCLPDCIRNDCNRICVFGLFRAFVYLYGERGCRALAPFADGRLRALAFVLADCVPPDEIFKLTKRVIRALPLQNIFQHEPGKRYAFHKIGGAEHDVVEFCIIKNVRF